MKNRVGNSLLLAVAILGLVIMPGCAGLAQGMQKLSEEIAEVGPVLGEAAKNASEAVANGKQIVDEGGKIVDEMKEMEKEARVKADLDKSGSLDSIQEYLLYGSLLAAGGTGIFAARQRGQVQARKREDEIQEAVKRAVSSGPEG